MAHLYGILLNFSGFLVGLAIVGRLNFIDWQEKLILGFLVAILVEFAIRPIVFTIADSCKKQ